jgi:hypothetical protein
MMLVHGDVVMASTFDYVEGLLFELTFESVKDLLTVDGERQVF